MNYYIAKLQHIKPYFKRNDTINLSLIPNHI